MLENNGRLSHGRYTTAVVILVSCFARDETPVGTGFARYGTTELTIGAYEVTCLAQTTFSSVYVACKHCRTWNRSAWMLNEKQTLEGDRGEHNCLYGLERI